MEMVIVVVVTAADNPWTHTHTSLLSYYNTPLNATPAFSSLVVVRKWSNENNNSHVTSNSN